jgi:hypothetical protein
MASPSTTLICFLSRSQRLGFEPKDLLDALDKMPPEPAPSLSAARDDAGEDSGEEGERD